MKLYVNMKQIGKKKNKVDKMPYEIPDDVKTVKDLICAFVTLCVERFNNKEMVDFLSAQEIEDKSTVGKIEFQDRENQTKADLEGAISNALLSYEDGIYRIFLNEDELGDLNSEVVLKQEDTLTFIRLTMLAGRMW